MPKKKKQQNLHQRIEDETPDPFERSARVSEETSNDGKFSRYERADDGVTVIQYRGAPSK